MKHTLGDLGRAERGFDQNITTLGSESRGDSLGKSVDTLQELSTSFNTELELLETAVSFHSPSFGRHGKQILDRRIDDNAPCEQIAVAGG